MKVKKYFVTMTNPTSIQSVKVCNLREVESFLSALDYLWGAIDFDEWVLEIAPCWEEVPDNA